MNQALFRTLLCAFLLPGITGSLGAQTPDAKPAETPKPVTTADPDIPIENLRLLVKPLTVEDLQVEANAWRDLVKARVLQIAERQIGISEQHALADEAAEKKQAAADEKAADAKQADDTGDSGAAAPAAQPDSGAAEDPAEKAVAEKEQLTESLLELQEERSRLIERMTVVTDALEKKGGDVESYRLYISAVSGLDVPLTDAKTTWTVLKGWLSSEQGGRRWAWNLGKFLLILLCFYFAASIAAAVARHTASRFRNVSQLLVNFLGSFVKQVVFLVGFMVALSALEINIGPLLAAVGAAGFVIAFALQGTLSNFASGLLILAYRPFDVGHVIEAAGISGIVDSVSLFSTHVRTFDNKLMIVPNNDIWGGTITNATSSDTRRVDMTFGIGYDDDIDRAREILERLVAEHELVLEDPAPTIKLNELGESSVNFICRPWTKTKDYWTVYWDMTRAVKAEFDRHGISIPFPQRDIHVYHAAAPGGAGQQAGSSSL